MPTLEKLLSKFDKTERTTLESIAVQVISLDWRGLNVKKLKGYQDVFRVKRGQLRIIFAKKGSQISFFSIERRSETTYKF